MRFDDLIKMAERYRDSVPLGGGYNITPSRFIHWDIYRILVDIKKLRKTRCIKVELRRDLAYLLDDLLWLVTEESTIQGYETYIKLRTIYETEVKESK